MTEEYDQCISDMETILVHNVGARASNDSGRIIGVVSEIGPKYIFSSPTRNNCNDGLIKKIST